MTSQVWAALLSVTAQSTEGCPDFNFSINPCAELSFLLPQGASSLIVRFFKCCLRDSRPWHLYQPPLLRHDLSCVSDCVVCSPRNSPEESLGQPRGTGWAVQGPPAPSPVRASPCLPGVCVCFLLLEVPFQKRGPAATKSLRPDDVKVHRGETHWETYLISNY